ncbi:hypothetical protein GD627_09390 [Arthrobacter yangruifuii]|uniref:Uncharacterized protein n=1 Tax=Arthrobacter yangruifuii TaxID=2606616 RepID=A0A5N6MJT3_9MICC|nr:hypothetical protein [Arthrobacter yangruifuii]KAD3633048.1 hypothetical protein GD627_09390 [Arthrobacter yangruifuii]
MVAGVVATFVCGAFTVGIIALGLFLKKLRKVDKKHPHRRSQIRFRPRGFRGVVLFIGAIGVLLWTALLLSADSDLPTWVFSIACVFIMGALHPVLIVKSGDMFVLAGEDEAADG